MTEPRSIPHAPDAGPAAGMRAQAGGSGMQRGQGNRLVIALLGGPVLWIVHFLGVYFIVVLWCAARWPGAGVAIGAFTVACTLAALATAALAFRLWRRGQAALVDDAEPGDPQSWDARMGERGARMAFLAVLALFMAALFTLLIVLEGIPPLFTQACPATTMP